MLAIIRVKYDYGCYPRFSITEFVRGNNSYGAAFPLLTPTESKVSHSKAVHGLAVSIMLGKGIQVHIVLRIREP